MSKIGICFVTIIAVSFLSIAFERNMVAISVIATFSDSIDFLIYFSKSDGPGP